eukprot:4862769-Amphidinium_carterae.1
MGANLAKGVERLRTGNGRSQTKEPLGLPLLLMVGLDVSTSCFSCKHSFPVSTKTPESNGKHLASQCFAAKVSPCSFKRDSCRSISCGGRPHA